MWTKILVDLGERRDREGDLSEISDKGKNLVGDHTF